MLRFDDRQPPRGKDGDDFQKFVWEALRSGHFERFLAGRYVRPYFAAGNDGAIDHLAIGDRDQIVIECKFFGKERKGLPAGDWKDLADTLGPNLRANAERDIDSIARHYRPWFDTARPIKGYWFCTSGVFQPGAQAELRQEISAADRKKLLQPAIQMLEQSCPDPGLWSRVGINCEEDKKELHGRGEHDLEEVLEKLSDIKMRPHDWSNIWEKEGWRYFPGESRLVALAQEWLREAAADPSWPFVWEPLFLYFPESSELTEIALWWLENRGPRERGAWAFVWKALWDHACARDRLDPLGRAWLQVYEGTHKYWKDIRVRLDAATE
jgi:hypothetical protein